MTTPTDPHVVETKPYSAAVVEHKMSNDTVLYGCSWPGCHYSAESPGSIGSHYKSHSGGAAQRRRARQRPRTASTGEIVDTALALLDLTQALLDKVDAWEAEHQSVKTKAERFDALRKSLTEDE